MRFRCTERPEGVLVSASRRRLLGSQEVPPAEWPAVTGKGHAAGRYLLALAESGEARLDENGVLLPHAAVAALPSSVAEAVGLPPLANLSVTVSFEGIMTDPAARIRTRWYDADTRWVRMEREGAVAKWGPRGGRLSQALFELSEAVDAYNATQGRDAEERIAAWAPVQAALRKTTGTELETGDDYLTSLTIYQAGAVALDVFETSHGPDFLPVVMAKDKAESGPDDGPDLPGDEEAVASAQRDLVADALLPPDLQRRFARELFSGEARSHDAYVLDRGTYLVLEPDLKTALDVVRRKRAAPREERVAFLRNPRPALAVALGEDTEDRAGALLVETWQYSQRVLGLGLWTPPAMPWLKNQAGQWLPERFPLTVGERTIEVDQSSFGELKTGLAEARAEGEEALDFQGEALRCADVEEAFVRVGLDAAGHEIAEAPGEEAGGDDGDRQQPDDTCTGEDPTESHRLVIYQNLEGQEFEISYHPREVSIPREFPALPLVRSRPKPHQVAGFDWLVESYRQGWPGVLLADDMGLGKTFQALAFLAWLKANRRALGTDAGARNRPALVVAPAALLRNWASEAEQHLGPDALGRRVDAFGAGLRRLRTPRDTSEAEESALDLVELRRADWILTTYETLANYHRAFARIGFSVAVFDEAQKIKSPGAINTQSAKAMNADFVLALTGTPIENRLADLWCIMDRVVPGYLGDLKGFVSTYEEGTPEDLKRLKARLDESPTPERSPVLMRRMKAEILEGLPARSESRVTVTMPPAQAEAYEQALARARAGGGSQGEMLRAIHAFRGISLHPDGASNCDPLDPASVNDWLSRSARLRHAVEVLERLVQAGEKALVFVEDLKVQKCFAAAIATRLGLSRQPAIINGQVAGEKRLEIVDRFQASENGFDLLVLSPKAAGVGLTITAANHVIHLSRWWNPAVEDQCNDRCYRIGQHRPVTVHIPLAVHPVLGEASFDVKLDALLERKRLLSREMLMPPVSDGDVEALFSQTTGDEARQGSPASAR